MKRGEAWLASLDPLNDFLRTTVTVPLTTNLKWGQYDFCVFVPQQEAGLTGDSVVLCHQVRVTDKTRLMRRMGQVTEETLAKVEQAVSITLGT